MTIAMMAKLALVLASVYSWYSLVAWLRKWFKLAGLEVVVFGYLSMWWLILGLVKLNLAKVVELNQENVLIYCLVVAGLGLGLFRKRNGFGPWLGELRKSVKPWAGWWYVGFVVLVFYIVVLRFRPVIGADSQNYLVSSGSVILTGKIDSSLDPNFDRSLIKFFPSLLSISLGVDLELSLKLLAFGLFVVMPVVMAAVMRNVGNSRIASITLVLSTIAPGWWRISWDMFAMSAGWSVFFCWVWWVMRGVKQELWKTWTWWIGAGLIQALMFHLHGMVAFGTLVFCVAVYGVLAVYAMKYRYWSVGVKMLVMVVVVYAVGLPLIGKGFNSFVRYSIQPVVRVFSISESPSRGLSETQAASGAAIANVDRQSEKVSSGWERFEIAAGRINELVRAHGLVLLSVGLVAFVVLLARVVLLRDKLEFFLVGLVGYMGLMTQLELVGINLYIERYVFSFGLALVMLQVMLLKRLEPAGRVNDNFVIKLGFWLTFGVLIVVGSNRSIPMIEAFKPSISEGRYQMFREVSGFLDQDYQVFAAVVRQQWLKGLNPSDKLTVVEPVRLCDESGKIDIAGVGWARLEGEELVNSLEETFGPKHVLLINEKDSCGVVDKLEKLGYIRRSSYKELVLLEKEPSL